MAMVLTELFFMNDVNTGFLLWPKDRSYESPKDCVPKNLLGSYANLSTRMQ